MRGTSSIGRARGGGHGAEGVQHLAHPRPPGRVGVQAAGHQRQQPRVEPAEVVLAAADPVHDRHRRAAPERRPAGAGERHRGRPAVHVGGGGRVLAVQRLGGDVAGGAEQPAGAGEAHVVGDLGQAEVDEDRGAALHQHVGRLDVAVQHAGRVHGVQGLGERAGEPGQVGAGDRALLLDVVGQREARHVAGGDVRDGAVRVGVDDLGDPGALHPAQRVDLTGQPVAGLVVPDHVRPEHLDRETAPVGGLPEVDHAHAALAQPGQHAVGPDHDRAGRRARRLRGRRHAARLPVGLTSGVRDAPTLRFGPQRQRNRDTDMQFVTNRCPWRHRSPHCQPGQEPLRRPGASSRTCRRRGRTGCRRATAGSASSGRSRPVRAPRRRPT